MALHELVSTISLGDLSSLGRTKESKKVLVEPSSFVKYRGLAGTTKVTYSQACAIQNE